MSESPDKTFAAIITISLPGSDKTATAHLTLMPGDVVPASGACKPLAECTLADLQKFADQWEAEVWETYEEISLLELAENQHVNMSVALVDGSGETQPLTEEILADAVVQLETAAATEVVEEIPVVDMSVAETPGPPEAGEDTLEPQISISEPELVYEEREAITEDGDAPMIVPSRARVRIAGRRLPIGSATWMAVDIIMEEPALRAAQAHALSSLSREVAGVLLGPPPEKQPDGRYVVHIFDTIIAKHTVMKGASVTYTPESWRYMNDRLDEKYPDRTAVMVGWYHTHPGFGIFLSGMDQFIHQNFFTQIWHVAQVLDPVARTNGFFCWNREKNQVKRVDFPWPDWAAGSW
jgi:proteasome lid subunit RPN8/RPN11